jgi:hypothetical protein
MGRGKGGHFGGTGPPCCRIGDTAMTTLKKINIDGIEVEVDGEMTIIQAAEVAGPK